MKVPHFPGEPSQQPEVQEIDEVTWVERFTYEEPDKPTYLQVFVFQRRRWKHGGYVVSVQCQGVCNVRREAGGRAGETKLALWASRHVCGDLQAESEPEEESKPFRD